MKSVAVLLLLSVWQIAAQSSRYEPFAEKPGSCPPALPVQICSRSCYSDLHCLGSGKCCPTRCGGAVCSRPVTMKQTASPEKAGSCPSTPTGRWVCSPTCSTDSDCRGSLKCCKNRCGALACQRPQSQAAESAGNEVPAVPGSRPFPYYMYNTN